MASLYKKVISGKPYWYLREMARVDGKPKMVSERYLGSGADIEALLDAREGAAVPERTRHLGFGGVAATWGVLDRLDVIGVIDSVVGPRRADAGASIGTYLALAALNRVVAPCSKLAFADWWKTTAGNRFTRVPAGALDHRRFWDAMHAITVKQLAEIEHRLALAMVETFDLDISSLALDMTNFATYIDSGNDKAPIAQRGKAKQKRTDLRLVGLGLVVTRDGGVPLVAHAYPGNRLDVTQFQTMVDLLHARHTALATQARANTRLPTATVTAEIDTITHDPWLRRVLHTTLTGATPAAHRLTIVVDSAAREALEEEVFGKRVLITNRDHWSVADVVAAYRSQSEAEFSFRQLKDPHVVSFSPMHHWTEHNIRVHTFTCVLALQLAHLMRRESEHAGLHLSVRDLLDQLGGIEETVLIYPTTGGRPKARRMLTETNETQDQLTEIFDLTRWSPRT